MRTTLSIILFLVLSACQRQTPVFWVPSNDKPGTPTQIVVPKDQPPEFIPGRRIQTPQGCIDLRRVTPTADC